MQRPNQSNGIGLDENAETKDLALRLLEYAQQRGQWVGVSYQTLGRDLVTDANALREHDIAHRKARKEERDARRLSTRTYNFTTSLLKRKSDVKKAEPLHEATAGIARPKDSMLVGMLLYGGQLG